MSADQTSSESSKPNNNDQKWPNEEDVEKLKNSVKQSLNKDGNTSQYSDYVDSTFNYMDDIHKKMESSDDPKGTADGIAKDLASKFEQWKNNRKEEEESKEGAEETNK
ncbi:Piso0_002669 [Millerozyma farinosa CBS 7064]|uniref:Piso0_002669 protein n=1 Tax=Pichia sorbitophila (strain ATCC MYA-4447 / BCRC 22081 / CBS 7064 / NBRC 10061 / NRRL Y-12695) TaxID=559304 RepID=G8YD77_PICSO|nr:Piso0_002669 [Millerozyma farinosa CBS 7064]